MFGNGGTIDGQERPVGAPAMAIKRPSNQLLAGAARARDEYRDILSRDSTDGFVNLLHGGASADDGIRSVIKGFTGRDDGRNAHEAAYCQGLIDNLPELGQFERLKEIFKSSELHGFNGRVRRALSRDKDNQAAGIERS